MRYRPDTLSSIILDSRNKYRIPLNTFLVVDEFFHSRSVLFSCQRREDTETHTWVLHHLRNYLVAPDGVMASDFDAGFCAAVKDVLPERFYILCLHHMCGNISEKMRSLLGNQDYVQANGYFWSIYRSTSPDEFDLRMNDFLERFPTLQGYFQSVVIPTRHQWAGYSVNSFFTAGLRTTGRLEKENAINKTLGDLKTSIVDLVD